MFSSSEQEIAPPALHLAPTLDGHEDDDTFAAENASTACDFGVEAAVRHQQHFDRWKNLIGDFAAILTYVEKSSNETEGADDEIPARLADQAEAKPKKDKK